MAGYWHLQWSSGVVFLLVSFSCLPCPWINSSSWSAIPVPWSTPCSPWWPYSDRNLQYQSQDARKTSPQRWPNVCDAVPTLSFSVSFSQFFRLWIQAAITHAYLSSTKSRRSLSWSSNIHSTSTRLISLLFWYGTIPATPQLCLVFTKYKESVLISTSQSKFTEVGPKLMWISISINQSSFYCTSPHRGSSLEGYIPTYLTLKSKREVIFICFKEEMKKKSRGSYD